MLRDINTDTTHRRPATQAHRARPAASRAENSKQNEERRYEPMTKKQIVNETLDMLDEEYIHKIMIYAWTLLEIQEERKLSREE